MLLNMLNDLAEAMKASDGKKDPIFGSKYDPKMGPRIGSHFHSFFVQSRSLSGRHVSLVFCILFLGAMMKQVCWHSIQGLPRPARGTHGSLKVAAHVLVKPWFAAPPPCTFHCFVRKVKCQEMYILRWLQAVGERSFRKVP